MIRPSVSACLSASERNVRGKKIAAAYLRDEPALLSSGNFGEFVRQGDGAGESGGVRLLIGDQAGISLIKNPHKSRLEYRMAALAKSGDVVLIRQRDTAFEDYLRRDRGCAEVTFLSPEPSDEWQSVARLARRSTKIRTDIRNAVGERSLTIVPYQTTGDAWFLADRLGRDMQRAVYVSGPSPRSAQRANDKIWFTDLAHQVLGRRATPLSMTAFGPAAAAGRVARLARKSAHVIVKVPDSAGAAGNIRLDSDVLRGRSPGHIRTYLLERLQGIGWTGRYPLLVGVWDENVISSPSVQMKLPLMDKGAPVVLGVFDQRVRGSVGEFIGAAPAAITATIQHRLTEEAHCLAAVLQRVGYYGPCSFDAVLIAKEGASEDDAAIHWIECNGRWTGVSIPLAASNVSVGHDGFCVVQARPENPAPISTGRLLSLLDDLLLGPRRQHAGLVLLAPPGPGERPTICLMALAADQTETDRLANEAMQRLHLHTAVR